MDANALEDLIRKQQLTFEERRELHLLRSRVKELEGIVPTVVEESAPRMVSSPMTLTSGGIQYAVTITLKK